MGANTASMYQNLYPPHEREMFGTDPIAFQAEQCNDLFTAFRDPLITDPEKSQLLDDYFRKIVDFDLFYFPDTDGVIDGVPDGYIPDGFVDLGVAHSPVPSERYGVQMNHV